MGENKKKDTNKNRFNSSEKNTKSEVMNKSIYLDDDGFEDFDISYYKNKEKTSKKNQGRGKNPVNENNSAPKRVNGKGSTSNVSHTAGRKDITNKSRNNIAVSNKTSVSKMNKGNANNSKAADRQAFQDNISNREALGKNNSRNNRDTNSKTSGINSFPVKAGKMIKNGTCPYSRDCGGCNILQQSYDAELQEKQKAVEKLLNKYCKVEPILGMKEPKYYRNKVHVVFDHDRKGNPLSGVYQEGTHRVIPIENCLIHNQKADAIITTIRSLLKSFKIMTYDEDSGYGLLRHVLIRTGYASNEIMVVLVLASPIMPSKNNFVKALREKHPEITTVVINVNDKQTSMVLGDKEQVIYGKGYIEDRLCGKVFRISPKSFYQVNPAQTELLYGKAIELAGLTGDEIVIDAYCGTGTIGIIASDRAQRVIGIELNKDAVRDANINAKRNDTRNIEFYNNDAGVFMSQMAAQRENADVVFMDPPRSGSSEQFLDALVLLKPKKIVYISCKPVTLERDLGYLVKKGYKAVKAVPVDMFPWTTHVETVVLLSNEKKKAYHVEIEMKI